MVKIYTRKKFMERKNNIKYSFIGHNTTHTQTMYVFIVTLYKLQANLSNIL